MREGEISEDEAIDLLMRYHKTKSDGAYHADTEDEAWKKVQEWAAKAEHADEEDYDYNQYDAIDEALAANKDITALVKDLTDHGVKAESVKNHVKDYLVDRYVEGGVTESALKNQLSRYCGITVKKDVDKILKNANSKKEFGVNYDDLDVEYRAGKITKAKMKSALMKYGGLSGDEADKKIRWYDLQKANPKLEISEARANAFYDGTSKAISYGYGAVSATGMTIKQYIQARDILDEITTTDADGDGKPDTNSKEKAYIAAIDAMDLTGPQKWALYHEVYKGVHFTGKNAITKPNWKTN